MELKRKQESDKVSSILRILVGGYLTYLGISLLIGVNWSEAIKHLEVVGFGVFFFLAGAFVMIFYAREYYQIYKDEGTRQENDQEESDQEFVDQEDQEVQVQDQDQDVIHSETTNEEVK